MAEPIKLERKPLLAAHIDTPPSVRDAALSIASRASRIAGILKAPAALPEMRERAKADLIVLAREALNLNGEL